MQIYLHTGIKALISYLLMVTVFPLCTMTALILLRSPHWQEAWPTIGLMWIFVVVIPGPFWLTGIPAIIAILTVLTRFSKQPAFRERPWWGVLLRAMLAGLLLGALIMLPTGLCGKIGERTLEKWMIFMPFGALAGFITIPLITFLYRIPDSPHTPSCGAPLTSVPEGQQVTITQNTNTKE
jgi:hypothetical protein